MGSRTPLQFILWFLTIDCNKMFFIFSCVIRSPPGHTKPLDYFFGMLVFSKQFIFQFLDSHKLGLTSFSALRCVSLDP